MISFEHHPVSRETTRGTAQAAASSHSTLPTVIRNTTKSNLAKSCLYFLIFSLGVGVGFGSGWAAKDRHVDDHDHTGNLILSDTISSVQQSDISFGHSLEFSGSQEAYNIVIEGGACTNTSYSKTLTSCKSPVQVKLYLQTESTFGTFAGLIGTYQSAAPDFKCTGIWKYDSQDNVYQCLENSN